MSSLWHKIQKFLREDPLLSRFLKNTGYLFSSSMISSAIIFVQSILAARLLGVKALGLVTVAISFSAMVHQLFSFRMGEFIVRFLSKALAEKNMPHAGAVVKASFIVEGITSLVAFTFLLLVAPLGAKYIAKDTQSLYLFQIFAFSILTAFGTETANGVLRVLNHYKIQGWMTLIQSIITFALITIFFFLHGNTVMILLAYLAGKIFIGISPVIVAVRKMEQEVSPDWWKYKTSVLPSVKEMSRFAVSTNLSGTLKFIVSEREDLWVSYFLGTEATGLLKIALGLVNILVTPITPINFAAFPEITRSVVTQKWAQLRKLLKRTTLISTIWTVAVILGMVIFGNLLLKLYGEEYLPAYPTLIILLIGYGFTNIFFWSRSLLLAFGKANIPVYVMGGAGLLKVVSAFFIVPKFGLNAEAFLLVGYFILSIGLMVLIGMGMIRKSEQNVIEAEAA